MRNKYRGLPLAALVGVFLWLYTGCGGKANQTTNTKFTQYYRQGQQLYTTHCSNCHQADGSGLARVYPPLDSSDYMANNFDAVACLIRNGIPGPLTVNGIEFVQPMPGIPTLTDLEIAEIMTYIYNTWGRDRGIVEVTLVAETLDYCPPQ